jgi:signal transduction histidine kinase
LPVPTVVTPTASAADPKAKKTSPVAWAIRAAIVVVALQLASGFGLVWATLHSAALVAVYVVWGRCANAAARQRTGWERTAWRWFAATGWILAGLIGLYAATRFISPATAADWGARAAAPLVAHPVLMIGFLHLARRGGRTSVLTRGLDAILVAGGAFFVLWSAVFRDLFHASPLELDERLEVMSYPTMAAALVATAWLVLGRDGLARRSYRLAAMAATVPLATDLIDSVLELGGDPRGALFGDLGFLAAALLWILAALAAAGEGPWIAGQRRPATRVENFLPLGVLGLAMATALQTINEHGAISKLQFWVAFGLIATLLVRMGVTLAENMRLERIQRAESAFKTQLLRFISHEVANPISPLRVQLSLLGKDRPPEEERAWAIVDRSIERLLSLSRDVREMALAETQRLVTQVEVTDAGRQVADAAQSAAPLAKQRNLELVMHAPLEPLLVRADVQRLGQVVDNLLSNALKFTHAPGTITVRVEREGDRVRIRVTDTGIGLSPADRDGLFQPFRRAQDGAAPGLGLGLYLSKAIMAELHGRIGVDSPGRGQGATFWVELPLEGTDPDPLPLGRKGAAPARVEPVPTATVRLA